MHTTQISYSRLWGGPGDRATEDHRPYTTDREALAARDKHMRELRKQGKKVKGWTLRNQLRKYWAMGVPCSQYCTVYMINIYE